MLSSLTHYLNDCKLWDDQRPSAPGEHWIVAGLGLAALLASQRSDSPLKRAIGSAVGGAMLVRAASGRDGLLKLLPAVPSWKDGIEP